MLLLALTVPPSRRHVLLRLNKFLRAPRVLERLREFQHGTKYAMSLELVKVCLPP